LLRELGTLYAAFSRGEPSPLPELPIQYADYAAWQSRWLQGQVLEQKAAYWKRQLGGLAVSELPADHPRPAVRTVRGGFETLDLPAELTAALQALSQQSGATTFMVLLAALTLLLGRYTGQDDIAVGAPVAGRIRRELEPLIGFFVNSLVLRTDLSGNPTFVELLERVRGVALEALAHQELPFEKLLEVLQVERDPSRTPLFQVFLNMHNVERPDLALPDLSVEALTLPEVYPDFDLTVYAWERGEQIRLRFVYNCDLFTPARIREMAAQYQHLLAQVAANPGQQISDFSLVTPSFERVLPDPRRPLSAEWHGSIHDRVVQHAQQNPQRLAVVDSGEAWTYRELERRSSQLANYLIAQSIRPGDIVAIYGHRSASLVWAILGVLRAGATFHVLDSAHLVERLMRCLSLAQPSGWIQLEAAGRLPTALDDHLTKRSCNCRIVLPGRSAAEERELLAGFSDQGPQLAVGPEDQACVVFTSGSTGEPKGVIGTHGSLTHFEPWRQELCALTADDRFSMLSGLSHSPLQRDIFTALWSGATICVPDPSVIAIPGRLAAWMAKQRITVANLTPAMGQVLTETAAPGSLLPHLRYVYFVGDKVTRRDVARLRRLAPNVTCINEYGATETQRANAFYVVPQDVEEEQDKALYPLGHGIPDVQLLVLNGAGHLAGVGELGEIHMRSPNLAVGYLRDERLTRERFLSNPFTSRDDDCLYRTGDLGRYLPDGDAEFAGRADRQLKIRGFRIEPAEIESALEQQGDVCQVAVVGRDDLPAGQGLVAYVVAKEKPGPSAGQLRGFLRDKLPEYMVPSVFVLMDALPLTPNGKLDLSALPAPGQARSEPEKGLEAPRDELERQLLRIWEEVLGVDPIGIGDSFFELGGHSLLGIRLFARIKKELGLSLPVASLFRSPTIEGLAQALRSHHTPPGWSALVPIQEGGSRPPLFCVHGWGGGVLRYAELARLLGPDQPVYGLLAKGESGPEEPDVRIEDMAAYCLRAMRTRQPHGSYYLGGYCLGGVVAFEIAGQLEAQGEQVALLAVMDRAAPNRAEAIRDLRHRRNLARFLLHLPVWLRHMLASPAGGRTLLIRLHRRLWRRAGTEALEVRVDRAIANRFDDKTDAPESLRPLMVAHLQAARAYKPQPYSGRLTLFRVQAQSLFRSYDPGLGWGRLAAGGVEVQIVPGMHNDMLEQPYVAELAAKLRECLAKPQEQSSRSQAAPGDSIGS